MNIYLLQKIEELDKLNNLNTQSQNLYYTNGESGFKNIS